MSLVYENETYSIIGAAMEVHQELGHGFLEAVYQEVLEKEFRIREIPYKREVPLTIYYKNEPLEKLYIADFICYEKIIVELKAIPAMKSGSPSNNLSLRISSAFSTHVFWISRSRLF